MELLAVARGYTIRTLVDALEDFGFASFRFDSIDELDAAVDKYLNHVALWRKTSTAAWDRFRANRPTDQIVALLRQYRLHGLTGPEWTKGFGQLLGCSTPIEIERALHRPNRLRGGRGSRPARRFDRDARGSHVWTELLVMPYERFFGDIVGFGCVGECYGRPGRTFVRVRSNRRNRAEEGPRDPGLWGLATVEYGTPILGKYVIGMADPLLALRLQARHIRLNDEALSIVSWVSTREEQTLRDSWSAIGDRELVLIDHTVTAELLHAAYESGGRIALVPGVNPQCPTGNIYTGDLSAYVVLKNAVAHSMPWQQAVKIWASHTPEPQIRAVFQDLRSRNIDTAAIERELDLEYQYSERKHRVLVNCDPRAKASHSISETYNGWHYGRTGFPAVLISDVIIRVHKITVTRNITCEGVFIRKGKSTPFCCDVNVLDRPVEREQFIERHCIAGGLGLPRLCFAGHRPLSIAALFHEPVIVQLHKRKKRTRLDKLLPKNVTRCLLPPPPSSPGSA